MEEQGPFDRILQSEPEQRRDRTATVIVAVTIALGLLLLILVLPPISVFDDGNNPTVTGPVTARLRDDLPPLPPGFEAVSALFDLVAQDPVRAPARLTLSLSVTVSENDELVLYTYGDDGWRRLGDAEAVANGNSARGDVVVLPPNIVVLRRAEQGRASARTVAGRLPPGAELDPSAQGALAVLHPAGFTPAEDGSVSGDAPQLPAGLDLPVVPTIGALGAQEAAALQTILASDELRAAHVQAIVDFARAGDFEGVDLDYRTVEPALQEEFVSFVRELSAALDGDGRSLSLVLPLPVRQEDGFDTQGFDWEALAPLADTIELAMVPEQDLYFQRMEEALGYLVPRIGGGKLLLPVGPLSRERGPDGVRALTLTEALTLASVPATDLEGPAPPGSTVLAMGQNLATESGGSGLRWDDTARAVVFSYLGPGGERTVWLANVFSEAFKLDLARRYQLGGVVVEDVSRRAEDAGIWPAVRQYAQTGEVTLVKPNGSLLQPRWSVSGGALQNDTGPQVSWRAPEEAGTYTLTLIVSDGVTRVGQELRVSVESAAGAAAR